MRGLLIAAAGVVWSASAFAQAAAPEDLDRLKRMLDERLPQAPRTRRSPAMKKAPDASPRLDAAPRLDGTPRRAR